MHGVAGTNAAVVTESQVRKSASGRSESIHSWHHFLPSPLPSTHSDLSPFIEYSPFLTAPHEAVQVP